MAHTIIEFKTLTLLQSLHDLIAGTNYTATAPEADPTTTNPFIDNGLSVFEQFHTRSEEISAKLDYLIKIST